MTAYRVKLIVCILGIIASFTPSFAYSPAFWGMSLSPFQSDYVYVESVDPNSPAFQSHLYHRDVFRPKNGYEELKRELKEIKVGEVKTVTVFRDKVETEVQLRGERPVLSEIWYTDQVCVFSGVYFILLAILHGLPYLHRKTPIWRSLFTIAVCLLNVCSLCYHVFDPSAKYNHKFLVWKNIPNDSEWTFGQDYIAILASLVLIAFAVFELSMRFRAARSLHGGVGG